MKFVSRHSSFLFYLLVMLILSLIDGTVAGTHINLWILYGIPVGLATWNLGRACGLLLAAVGVLLLLITALVWGHPYAGLGYLAIAIAIASVSKALAYLVLVGLVGALRKQEVERVFKPSNLRQ